MFDLEKSIKVWRKELAKNPALAETDIFEIESALRDEVADLVRNGKTEMEAFHQTTSEMGKSWEINREFSKIRLSGRRGFLIGNYLRISLRKIRRQKGHSFINIASLSVGLASCILMMLWIKDDLSFDRFHINRDSMYRVIMDTKIANAESLDARTPTPLGQALLDEFPEVLDFSRYQSYIGGWTIKAGDKTFFDDILGIGDPSFFTLFSFPFIKGDPATALDDPRSIVLTESMARKCFGDQDPMGKIVEVTSLLDDYLVTGVIRDIPENSHIRFDCMIPIINTVTYNHIDYNDWNEVFFYSYIRLAQETSPDETAKRISAFMSEKTSRPNVFARLQPLKDIHLRSNFEWDLDNYGQGSITTLSTFTVAAAVILLLACINFMNLSTARASNRAKEVGLRKVTGAGRADIIKQFLGESIVLSFISLFLALFLVYGALPFFNSLSGKKLTLTGLLDAPIILALFGITLLTGLASGSYPALFLSAFRPAIVLKGEFLSGKRGQTALRKSLVVVQFTLTLFLVMGTIVVDRQLRYVRNKNLGINTNQVITLNARAPYETMKDAFLKHPNVLSMTQSFPPARDQRGISNLSWEGKNPDDIIQFYPVPVDTDYLETLGIEMAEGRFFSKNMPSDRTQTVIINETAAGILGMDSPIGKRLTFEAQTSPYPIEERTLTIIGVIKDFHQSSLHRAIEPMFFTLQGDQWPYICVRISPENLEETMAFLEAAWESVVPNYPFTYSFLNDEIENLYQSERKIEKILGLFTIIALFTACLGLFGLASFIAEKKTKEIGIRKILGASVPGLILMQTRTFAVWVLLANVIAWPAAYFAVAKWLQGFSYHIRPGIGLAVMAVAFSLSVALLTVGYKALKAALACPAQSLKYE